MTRTRTAPLPPAARTAFTLLELLAVVALSAVLASVAAVSFASAHRAARARYVADQVARYDRLTREGCRRFGRAGRITFDLDAGVIAREAVTDDADGRPNAPASLRLPAGFRIARLVSADATTTAGRVSLPCSARGQTPSYAVAIAGPGADQSWLLMAGLTGKVQPATDANEPEDIFKVLSAAAPESGSADDAVGDDAR